MTAERALGAGVVSLRAFRPRRRRRLRHVVLALQDAPALIADGRDRVGFDAIDKAGVAAELLGHGRPVARSVTVGADAERDDAKREGGEVVEILNHTNKCTPPLGRHARARVVPR